MGGLVFFLSLGAALLALAVWKLRQAQRRERAVRDHRWPAAVLVRWQADHPDRSAKDAELVARGLRQFFLVMHRAGRQPVAMPSRAVASMWQALAGEQAAYGAFCQAAFGRVVAPQPAVMLGPQRSSNSALRRCFWWACREEHLDPHAPTRLPLLFALDAKLRWPDGIRYHLGEFRRPGDGDGGTGAGASDTEGRREQRDGHDHDAADLRSERFDGSTSGFGDDGGGGGGDGGE